MEEHNLQPGARPAFRGFSALTLKLIALVTMTIDHLAASGLVWVNSEVYWTMRFIGRIAFPIYCFLLVEGFRHTHSRGKYLLRLVLFAVPSEPAFDLAFNGGVWAPGSQNVMPTLAIGLLVLWGAEQCGPLLERLSGREIPEVVARLCALPILLAGYAAGELLSTDYGGGGVLLIFLFYVLGQYPLPLTVGMAVLLYLCFGWVELWGLLALIPMFLYSGEKGRPLPALLGQYGFYAYYPLHLFLLSLLRFLWWGN